VIKPVNLSVSGFGFLVDEKTGAVVKKPQLLNVIIGNDVEIGANR
jgi:UDP-3-O-[3-hydroxymyristoyl] glucosamine N-acyltransferase